MPMTRSGLSRWTVAAAALVLSLTACGGGGHDAGTNKPAAGGSPTGKTGDILCSQVWAEGKTMPKHFEACAASKDSTTVVVATSKKCEDGRVLVTSSDKGWAFEGQKVNLLKDDRFYDDPDYLKADEGCAGTS